MDNASSSTLPFRFRLNCIDHYQSKPTSLDPQLPVPSISTQGHKLEELTLPVIRVFGATETGQKVCAHIHGTLPYLYLPYDGSLKAKNVNNHIKTLTSSINHALALSYRRNPLHGSQASYVAFISLIKGVPFYGYHVEYKVFLKIYLRNPNYMTRFADLLAQGVILAQVLQPYESHMQYLAQWMCDYNLYGCAFVDCEQVSFRLPLPNNSKQQWNEKSIPAGNVLDSGHFPRQSHCEIEIDVQAHHIRNRDNLKKRNMHHDFAERFFKPEPDYKFVPSMAGLWKDETVRRKKRMGLGDSDVTPFPPEALVTMSADLRHNRGNWIHEDGYFRSIQELIDKEQSITDRRRMTFETFHQPQQDLSKIQTAIDSVEEFYPENLQNTLANENFASQFEHSSDDSLVVDESMIQVTPPESGPYGESGALGSPKKRPRSPVDGEELAQPPRPESLRKKPQVSNGEIKLSPQQNKTPTGTQTSIDSSLKVAKKGGYELDSKEFSALLEISDQSNSQKPKIDGNIWVERSTFSKATFRNEAKEFHLRKAPPGPKQTMASILSKGGPSSIQQDAFYSQELDIPIIPKENINRQLKIGSKTFPFLAEFDKTGTSSANLGDRPPAPLSKGDLEFMMSTRRGACTFRNWQLATPPPSPKAVRKWTHQLERSSKNLKPVKLKLPADQIEGPTMVPRAHGPSQKSQTSVSHETQYMSVLSVEVHVDCRQDLNPDPAEDEITCIFWSIKTDTDDHDGPSFLNGIVVLVNDYTEEGALRSFKGVNVDFESSELEVLNKFVEILRQLDPDILVGYEIHNGSWGYLIDRAKMKYEVDLPTELSRVRSDHNLNKGSERYNLTTTSTIRVTGRHTINIWRAAQGEMNYLQYTMDNVVFQLLGKRIPHYSFQQLTKWHRSGSPYEYSKVIKYFLAKIQLNIRILDKMDIIARTSEQARLLGVDFFSVISRGSQFKVESLMFRIAKPENYILISPSRKQVGQQNALECLPLVMEPRSNFYPSPLLVLDFQSLYPSIMIAYNYCYSTCLGRIVNWRGTNKLGVTDLEREPGLLELLKKHVNVAPNGLVYVRPEMRRSLLAKMLTEILETRVMVKSGMKQDRDDQVLQRLLNNRQLALKLIANVTYGYTSASFSGRMPCAEIADSIVQTARETLEKTIAKIHSVKEWNAEVVYGDTDSLFIYLKNRTREEAFVLGKEIADTITKSNPRPIKLKFEKVYHPCVLLAKKRYVGWKYESADQKIPEFDAKGIETVRRDGTPAEQKIEEKALKILFRTYDMSRVKRYFQEQCIKIIAGNVSVQDFLFAREVKLGIYSENGIAPAGVMIATRKMQRDHRKEPQYGERVPYVVVAGAPGARLIDRCVDPDVLLSNNQLELDSEYYIGKNIIPPLDRIFGLVGANVKSWYDEIPKVYRLRSTLASNVGNVKTLETYLNDIACSLCGESMKKEHEGTLKKKESVQNILICDDCKASPSSALLNLRMELQAMENRVTKIHQVCRSCEGIAFTDTVTCDSHDCPVFYSRVRYESQLRRLTEKARVLVEVEDE